MDSFVPKNNRVDTVRSLKPNKSPRVTREEGSRGNKRESSNQHGHDIEDQIDIKTDLDIQDEEIVDPTIEVSKNEAIFSLKKLRDALLKNQIKAHIPEDANPDFKKAFQAYQTYLSQADYIVSQSSGNEGKNYQSKLDKIDDLIEKGYDEISVISQAPYEDIIDHLWDQEFLDK